MATRPKAVIESRNGEEFSPITIAKNVLTDDGQNLHDILSDRKEDMMTPTIENSSSMFKVGQGDNVDYSSNVVNGAYEDMVLKGKTMVNCIQESSSKDVVLPYEFADGQYVTINDTKESGALGVELKGQTLVNVVDYNDLNLKNATRNGDYFTLKHGVDINQSWVIPKKNKQYLYKPNTVYTIIVNITENTTGQKLGISNIYTCTSYINGKNRFDNLLGESKLLVRTGSDVNVPANQNEVRQLTYFGIWDGSGDLTSHIKFNFMILEGDWTDKETPPYFEGMASCKRPVLHTAGSLFDTQKIIPNNAFTYSHSTNIGRFEFTNRGDVVANTSIQLPAGTYDISFLIRGVCDNGRAAITFAKDGEAWYGCSRTEIYYHQFGSTTFKEVKTKHTFDAPVTVTIVGHAWAGGATGSGWCEFKDIRFTPVGKSSILSLPEEVVLRSLPNGVCDTFNTRTGEYVQRIGEITFTGKNEESWRPSTASYESDNVDSFYTYFNNPVSPIGSRYCNCNAFPTYLNTSNNPTYEYFHILNIDTSQIVIGINRSKLSSQDVVGFRSWLQTNPMMVQYELAIPIITKINLPSTLKTWNTTTHIYSEIPENTLYPILSHSNPTYPVILKPSTKYSIVANSYSNSHTNSPINFNLGGATATTTVGNRVTTITTPSTLSNELLTMSGRGNKLNNVMVIEGDVVGDEPYFEGICDCKSPILSNVGKNLFDVNGEWHKSTYSHAVPMFANGSQTITTLENGVQITTNNNQYHGGFGQFINIGGINKLRIAFTGEYTDTKTHPEIVVQLLRKGEELPKTMNNTLANTDYNPRKTSFKLSRSGETASKVISTQGYECAYVHLCGGYLASMSGTYTFVAKNICIEDADQVDIYEPYKSNTTTFEQKDSKTIVLRSLPNGVCDTLNMETGEYVQRIGELVANGDDTITYNGIATTANNTVRMVINHPSIQNNPNEMVMCAYCDRAKYKYNYQDATDIESFFVAKSNSRIFMRLEKSKLETLDVAGIKKYLSKTPYTFQYELKEPIVSTIDVQGFPYAYKNGHVQLSSGSIEQSLTPKVEYSVVTNRNGQIRSNQKMVERHQKQLDRLQAMILTNLVNTQYEQTLTNLKYDLKNVREEVK